MRSYRLRRGSRPGTARGSPFRPGTMVAYADTADRAARRAILRAGHPAHGSAPGAGARRSRYRMSRPSRSSWPPRTNRAGCPRSAGLSPDGGDPAGERYSLVIEDGQVVLRAAEPVGVARGLTTLIQLMATAPSPSANEIRVPAARILDAPRYAWRGLSLDVARTFFTGRGDPAGDRPAGALQAQRAAPAPDRRPGLAARPAAARPPARSPAPPSTVTKTSRDLVGYAADRFVTIVPEVDTPGHAVRAAAAAAGPEVRPERGRVRVPARPPPPRRVARPGAARDLRADGAGPGRGGRDLPGPLPAHRRGRAPRDAG